jgi:Family of unknown function (DUF6522)
MGALAMDADCEWDASIDLNELMAILVAVLRGHGHLCNVLTHVGRGNWRSIEAAIGAILAPRTRPSHLDPVARNVLELICDGRGVTGPIMRGVFFDIIDRGVSRYQASRLKGKIRRLRRKVAAADLALQEQGHSHMSAEPEISVQAQLAEQGAAATAPGQSSNSPPSPQSNRGISILHTPAVEFGMDGISVDAALIADGLGLDPASVPAGMGRGEIRAVCERGIDADHGLYRLTFFRPGHRVRLVVGTDGQVRQRSSIAFGKRTEVVQRLSA